MRFKSPHPWNLNPQQAVSLQNFVKPIFVSPGHKIDIDSSLRVILMCTKKYRIPEAIRLAHQLTQQRTEIYA